MSKPLILCVGRTGNGRPCVTLTDKAASKDGELIQVGVEIGDGETIGAALDRIDAFARMGAA